MRLLYNFTQAHFYAYNPVHSIPSFVATDSDLTETYDISHWTAQDLMDFGSQQPLDQLGQLAELATI
jgi:hypothetical protein